MVYPVQSVTRPSDLAGVSNGHLPSGLLRSVGPKGDLHHLAARAFEALRNAARAEGFHLTYTYGGTLRSYSAQESLFRRRYTPDYDADRNTYSSGRTWNGHRWYKLKGVAPVAVPGTSNHGWGLAIDLALDSDPADGIGPDDAVSISPALPWLTANAWRFGFSWELQSEPWHIRYVPGDTLPAAVLDFERNVAETEPTPPPAQGDRIPVEWMPVLSKGDASLHTMHLQDVINRLDGGPTLVVDGHFGPATEAAVKRWQSFLSRPVTGVVDTETWRSLYAWEAFLLAQPPVFPELKIGDRGKFVSYLQRVLQKCQPAVVVDGVFGAQTEKAVRAFQECVKIGVDGQVGPQTWEQVRSVGDGFEVARP